jgi:hypothetical protein
MFQVPEKDIHVSCINIRMLKFLKKKTPKNVQEGVANSRNMVIHKKS